MPPSRNTSSGTLTTPARYIGVLGSRSKRLSFLKELVADGALQLDDLQENEILREPLVCRGGEITNPRVREALS